MTQFVMNCTRVRGVKSNSSVLFLLLNVLSKSSTTYTIYTTYIDLAKFIKVDIKVIQKYYAGIFETLNFCDFSGVKVQIFAILTKFWTLIPWKISKNLNFKNSRVTILHHPEIYLYENNSKNGHFFCKVWYFVIPPSCKCL